MNEPWDEYGSGEASPWESYGAAETPTTISRPSYAANLAGALQQSNLYGTATTAFNQAKDKGIRRRQDGDWDLPMLAPLTGGAMDLLQGPGALVRQAAGQRLPDSPTGGVDPKQIQKVFHDFQQANNLSDEEVQAAWSDLGNLQRNWNDDEKYRVLSNGQIVPNPTASEWLDNARAADLVRGAKDAPEEAKAEFLRRLPQFQTDLAVEKVKAYEAGVRVQNNATWLVNVPAGAYNPMSILPPSEWAQQTGRTADVGTPGFIKDYESYVESQPGGSRYAAALAGRFALGFAKIANTALGVAGLAGSDTAAAPAAEGTEASNVARQGMAPTGIAGSVVEEIPSVLAQVVSGQALGAAAGAVTTSARAAQTITSLGVFGTAGLQSAGLTYADEIAQGTPEDEARIKAGKAGLTTMIVTAAFGTGAMGAVERVAAGKAAEGVTVREVLAVGRELGAGSMLRSPELRKLAGGVLASTVGEASEEGIDQLLSAFLTADPDTSLADAWSGAVEAMKVGGLIGTATSVSETVARELAVGAAPLAPASARAALEPETPVFPDKESSAGAEAEAPAVPPAPAEEPLTSRTPAKLPEVTRDAEVAPADRPSPNLPPRADFSVKPRPPQGGGREGRIARMEWDDLYRDTHNPDGSPIQPTVLEEVARQAVKGLKDASFDERIDAIGTDIGAELGTALKQLLNDGWVWSESENRMVDPKGRGETPLQALMRIRSGRNKQPAEPVLVPAEIEAPAPTSPAVPPAPAEEPLTTDETAIQELPTAPEPEPEKAIDAESDNATMPQMPTNGIPDFDEPQAPTLARKPPTLSREDLKKAFNLDDEQAEVKEGFARVFNLTTDRVRAEREFEEVVAPAEEPAPEAPLSVGAEIGQFRKDAPNGTVVETDLGLGRERLTKQGDSWVAEDGVSVAVPPSAVVVSLPQPSANLRQDLLPGITPTRRRSLSSMRAEVVRKLGDPEITPRREKQLTALLGRIETAMKPAPKAEVPAAETLSPFPNEEVYETAKSVAENYRSKGEPNVKLEARIAAHEAIKRGATASAGEVFSDIVEGHPMGPEVTDSRLAYTVPIKVSAVDQVERRIEAIQKLQNDVRGKLNLFDFQMKNAKTKAAKNKLEKGYPSGERSRDRALVDKISEEVEPALQKLYKQAVKLGLPETSPPSAEVAPTPEVAKKTPKKADILATSPTQEGIEKSIAKFYGGEAKTLVPTGAGEFALESPATGKRLSTKVVQTSKGFYFVRGEEAPAQPAKETPESFTRPEGPVKGEAETPARPAEVAPATRSRRLERMFGPNFEGMLNELADLTRWDDMPKRRQDLRETLAVLVFTAGFGQVHLTTSGFSDKIVDAMVAGKPNIVDKVLALQDISKAELTKNRTRPSAITTYGYEAEGSKYVHPKKPEAPVAAPTPAPVAAGITILPAEQASQADYVLYVSQGRNYFTLWGGRRDPRSGKVRYNYLTILSQDIDEARAKAQAYAQDLSAGKKLSTAFVGRETEDAGDISTLAVSEHLLTQDEIQNVERDRTPIADQPVGVGRGASRELLVRDLWEKDPGLANWIVGNAYSGRLLDVANYLKKQPAYLEAQDERELERARVQAYEKRRADREKGKDVPVTTLIRKDGEIVEVDESGPPPAPKRKLANRQAKDQVVNIVAPPASPSLVPGDLAQFMFPMQVDGANATLASMEKTGVALNGDGAGVGKTRQILAVAAHYAARGRKVFIITENAAIGKPWEKKGAPKLGGSMAKDSQAMGVDVGLLGETDSPIQISTYNRVKNEDIPDGAVLIFDESHNLANTFGANPEEKSAELRQWETKFRAMLPRAEAVAYYSATPADKPHQLAYLHKVLGFDTPEEYLSEAVANGMAVKTRKFGLQEKKYYDVPKGAAKNRLYKWVNGRMSEAGAAGRFIKREISYDGTDVQFADVVGANPQKNPWAQMFQNVLDTMSRAQDRGMRLLAPDSYVLYAAELSKIGKAVELAKREINSGRKVVIYFSRIQDMEIRARKVDYMPNGEIIYGDPEVVGIMPSPVGTLKQELADEGIEFAELHGKSGTTSQAAQKAFEGKVNVLLASVESGGTGINLDDTKGDNPRTEIFMFAPYRGISTVQAMGRIWRASTIQDDANPNRYIMLVASDVKPDAFRSAVLAKKLQLMDAAIGGTAVSRLPMARTSYSPEQLQGLEVPADGEENTLDRPKTGLLRPVKVNWQQAKSGNYWAEASADLLEWEERGGPDRAGIDIRVFKGDRGNWIALADRPYAPEEFVPEPEAPVAAPTPAPVAADPRTARFRELTADLDPTKIEEWKAANPEKLAELGRMKEEVLRESGYETGFFFGGNLPSRPRLPVFTTTQRSAAEWYASQRGTGGRVEPLVVRVRNPFRVETEADAKALAEILTSIGVSNRFKPSSATEGWWFESSEISKHSPYDGSNPLDVAYIPKVRQELVRRGYDALQGPDVLEESEIPATVLISDPTQIKSADPLQLDDSGNLITPDQWGDSASPDIRYQVDDRDSEYLAAVERGDMETAQRMVDEAARAAGYAIFYHGSTSPDVKTIEDLDPELLGFWAEDESSAATYTQGGAKPLRGAILITNPIESDLDPDSDLRYEFRKRDYPTLENMGYDAVDVLQDYSRHGGRVVIPFKKSQIKSADPVTRDADGNVIPLSQRFDSASPDIRYQVNPPEFFSQLSRVIDAKIQGRQATPEQVKAVITNPSNGVKTEEVKWSGVMQKIDALAAENAGKVPKSELLEYLANEGAVRFEEVVTGARGNPATKEVESFKYFPSDKSYSLFYKDGAFIEDIFLGEGASQQEVVTEALRMWSEDPEVLMSDRPDAATKFAQYTLPGGSNYREVVLAMPSKTPKFTAEPIREKNGQTEYRILADGRPYGTEWGETPQEAINAMIGQSASETVRPPDEYRSSHFPDVPNYVAHMRLNERTDAEGNEGLFVEELQSDRHQAGRKQGYLPDKSDLKNGFSIRPSGDVFQAINPSGEVVFESPDEDEVYVHAASYPILAVADAPYRKDWHLALFKRALRDAVASGKSWIGWTVGDTQNDRFDLSKQVSKVTIYKYDENSFDVDTYGLDGNPIPGGRANLSLEKLEEFIGRDLAKKASEQEVGPKDYTGIDLKVGGSGMKGFYDNMLPKEIGKYVKQWGAKVEKDVIVVVPERKTIVAAPNRPGGIDKVIPAETAPIWRIDITPEMARSIREAGQPLFQSPTARPQGAKGSAQLLPNQQVLLKGYAAADFTTAAHELIHAWEMLGFPGATDAEVAQIKTWTGSRTAGRSMMETPASEKLARGWERYLAEGKAPLARLQALFDKIAGWMLRTYKSLDNPNLAVDISPEVRAIFDKLASRLENPSFITTPYGTSMETADGSPLPPAIEPTPENIAAVETLDDVAGLIRGTLEAQSALPPEPEIPDSADWNPEGLFSMQERRALEEAEAYGINTDDWKQARRDFGQLWQSVVNAEQDHRGTQSLGSDFLDRIASERNLDRVFTDREVALLTHEGLRRKGAVTVAAKALTMANAEGDLSAIRTAQVALDDAMASYQAIHDVAAGARRASGRSLNAWKYALRDDFSYAVLATRHLAKLNASRVLNNKPPVSDLPKAEADALRKYAAEQEARVAEMKAEMDRMEGFTAEQQALIEELIAERKSKKKPAVSSLTKKLITDRVKKAAAEAKARLAAANQIDVRYQSEADPLHQDRVLVMAADLLENPQMTDARFADLTSLRFGKSVDAAALRRDTEQHLRDAMDDITGEEVPTAEEIMAEYPEDAEVDREMVMALARAHIYAGARNFEVLDRVHATIHEQFPATTREQVAQLFTRYGEFEKLPPDELEKALRTAKSLELVQKQIDDLTTSGRMKRTGRGKDDPSVELRELRKKRDDLAKDLGYVPRDPETQLSSAQAAAKKRLQNEIEEIRKALESGVPRVRVRRGVEYTEDLVALRQELEALRATYQDTFGRERTPEEIEALILKDLDRRIAREEDLIERGLMAEPEALRPAALDSAEITARRKKLSDLRQRKRDAYERANPGALALAQAMDAAEKALTKRQEIVAAGVPAGKPRKARDEGFTPTEDLKSLWAATDALDAFIKEVRRARPRTPAQERKRLDNAYDRAVQTREILRDRIAKGKLVVEPRTPLPSEARTKDVQKENKALRQTLTQMQRDKGVGPFSPEFREARREEILKRRLAEIAEKTEARDFQKKTRTEPATNQRIRELEALISLKKRDFEVERAKYVYSTLGVGSRTAAYMAALYQARMAFNLHGDLGTVDRQLGKLNIMLVHHDLKTIYSRVKEGRKPRFRETLIADIAAKAYRSFMDPENKSRLYQQMVTDPRYPSWRKNGFDILSPHDSSHELNADGVVRLNPLDVLSDRLIAAIMLTKGLGKMAAGVATGGLAWKTLLKGVATTIAGVGVGLVGRRLAMRIEDANWTILNVGRMHILELALAMRGNIDASASPNYDYDMTTAVMNMTGKAAGPGIFSKLVKNNPYALGILFSFPQYRWTGFQCAFFGPLARLGFGVPEAKRAAAADTAKLYGYWLSGWAMKILVAAAIFGTSEDDEETKGFGVVLDTDSPNFGRFKVGKTYIDLAPGARDWWADMVGTFERTTLDEEALAEGYAIEVPKSGYQRMEATKRLVQKQVNPNIMTLWRIGQGYTFEHGDLGKLSTVDAFNAIHETVFFNLTVNEGEKILKEHGPVQGPAVLGFLGLGANVQVSKTAEEKAIEKAEKESRYVR